MNAEEPSAEDLINAVEEVAFSECPGLSHLVVFLSDGEGNFVFLPLYPVRSNCGEVAERLDQGQFFLIGCAVYRDDGLCKVVELARGEAAPELVRTAWEIYNNTFSEFLVTPETAVRKLN